MYYRISILSIIVVLLLLIRIYILINSVDKSDNDTISSTIPTVTVYMCPQFLSSSKGYFHVDFTTNFPVNYKKICESDDHLLVYILSKVNHFDRRQAIRRTWANREQYEQLYRTCFIFLVGLGHNSSIQSEAIKYGDIVQLNINETYQNIVYKEVGGLKWSHLYASHIPYLFKTDDDIIIDTLLLGDITRFFINNRTAHSDYFQKHDTIKDFARQTTEINKYTLFTGMYIEGGRTFRGGKFGLDNLAWNYERLPGYCRGVGYMFSSFVRDRLYRASVCYAIEYVPWVGDLFVTGFLARSGAVQCSSWSMEYSQPNDGCSLRFEKQPRLLTCSTPIHTGRPFVEEYDQAWNVILHRHSINNETRRKNRTALYNARLIRNLPIKESIIEQMENNTISKGAPIVDSNEIDENFN